VRRGRGPPARRRAVRAQAFESFASKVSDLLGGGVADDEEAGEGEARDDEAPGELPAPPRRARAEKAEKAKEAEERAKPAAPTPKPAPRRRLRATLRLRQGRELVLELVVADAALAWAAPGAAQVRLDDGRLVAARLDVVRSTRAGSYAVGQVLRVVLTLADEPGATSPTLVTFDGLDLEVHPA
jgi:hypothetical protein